MKKIAFFDFDGTITTKDTLFEIIKYQKGKSRFWLGFLMNVPVMVAMKLKLISVQTAKEKVLQSFFRGNDLASFQAACDRFTSEKLPSILRPGALSEIKGLRDSGFEVTVVSASAENWIKGWSDTVGAKVLATKLETKDGLLTGKLDGFNCNGGEKAARIKSAYALSEYDEIYCYGDSSGDKPMLALGTKAFYKPFRD